MDCIWQLEMTSSVAGLRRSSKALAKAKFAPTKRSCSGFGGLLPVWSTTAFWILMKPLYLRSMLSKLMRCTRTSVPTASIGQQKGLNSPTACCTTNTSKVGWIGLQDFASSSVFTWPLANWISLFQASRQILLGNHFTTNRRQKKVSKSMPNPKAQIFML